jgi:hypothetical protein
VVSSVPFFFSAMSVGLSNSTVSGTPLPLSLDAFGLTGCYLYHDTVLGLALPCNLVGPGLAAFDLQVPPSFDLQGLHVYLQAWAPSSGQNPGDLVTSNAIDLTIGSY